MQLLFAGTLFVSAMLLFSVQPMFARMVLPRLGGAPGVWNTCMVFYQAVLLAGYLYAHVSTRLLGPRRQATLHLALMLLPWLVLPIGIAEGWVPAPEANPTAWLLVLLTVSVGAPLLVVSASAPMLQTWFAGTRHPAAKDPYFLYASSNLGSMLALLAYPILVEPNLSLDEQATVWAVGFGLMTALTAGCGVLLWCQPAQAATGTNSDTERPVSGKSAGEALSWTRRLRWLALAFVPSSLLLGVTAHIATDIASAPLLWVVPLALYLLSFVLVFARRTVLPHRWMVRVQPLLIVPVAAFLYLNTFPSLGVFLAMHLGMFFVTAMVCHGELAAIRPGVDRLTEFYIWIAVGGVLGGLFNAMLAPELFTSIIEYPLVIVLACMLRPATRSARPTFRARLLDILLPAALAFALGRIALDLMDTADRPTMAGVGILLVLAGLPCLCFQRRPVRFALGVGAIMLIGLLYTTKDDRVLYAERSFFGVLRVKQDSQRHANMLLHGSTIHGIQSLTAELRGEPLTYFHRTGPLGQIFAANAERAPFRRIGVIGLGTGTIASYGRPGQYICFYEIDPAVERIARNHGCFTFLRDSLAEVEVVLGDARLTLADAPAGHYDLLVLDAFSSDAIPVHLLTREAMQLYRSKLSDDGLLALHISNRFLDLAPVLARLAGDANLVCRVQYDGQLTPDEKQQGKLPSRWAILARQPEQLGALATDPRWKPVPPRSGTKLWTDDFSNILGVMKWR